jgi:hypothetical protein
MITRSRVRRDAAGVCGNREAVERLWVIEYEYNDQCWRTVVEHYTREQAMEKFRRDHPNVELRECYQP